YSKTFQGLEYGVDEILVASGGRPLIYALFRAICDKNDKIIYGVPSWNNNHYTHFVEGEHIIIEAKAENNFMLTAADIAPHIQSATFLSLCSPQNPTGTTFRKEDLQAICDLVVTENQRRGDGEKKLYVMFDQMYWQLTYGSIEHYNPVLLHPEMRPYTIFIDAVSKVFAATGVRVGWSLGPAEILNKMKAILSHVGAWAPMAEQKALAKYLPQTEAIQAYLVHFKSEVEERLRRIYDGLMQMKAVGLPVDAVAPEAAIYLTIKIELAGRKTKEGQTLSNQAEVTSYILKEAGLAVVPFHAFGASRNTSWYRLSVGTCHKEEINNMLQKLEQALRQTT
ncbi:MAG TPA: aminotransferase class I/II-fold pyridoxal phosphate-dependent enzyme, partial [Flavisolibacter sp.]|nr:aminotransferase class I/II-fold pyridoxal phosphate-dependent enzyme [Flavisolibacter sp.]